MNKNIGNKSILVKKHIINLSGKRVKGILKPQIYATTTLAYKTIAELTKASHRAKNGLHYCLSGTKGSYRIIEYQPEFNPLNYLTLNKNGNKR